MEIMLIWLIHITLGFGAFLIFVDVAASIVTTVRTCSRKVSAWRFGKYRKLSME